MIKLVNILTEQAGNEQPTQVVIIAPEAYATHMAWTRFLQRNKNLSVSKHTYPSDDLTDAATRLDAESADTDVAVVQLIANKQPLKTQITSVQALKQVCDRKGIRLVVIGPETESLTTQSSQKYQRLMQWLTGSNLDVVNISDLTNASYYDAETKNLNVAGNKVVAARVMRYLRQENPSIETDQPSDEEEKAAGRVNPAGKNAATPFVTLAGGQIAIPLANRRRTGETTDWETVMDYLIEKGLSQAGAAGIAGNIRHESNFKPDIYGDKGTSVGIVQWHASRMTGLFNFAKQKGVEPLSIDTQLEYLWWDLTKNYGGLAQSLKNATDPAAAAEEFAKVFERPTVISPKRMEYAQQYMEQYSTKDDSNSNWVGNSLAAVGAAAGIAPIALKTVTGKLSSSELKSIGGGHKLKPEAADAFLRMKAAYEAENPGKTIKVSDSYRPYEVQNSIFDWDLFKRTGKNKKIGTNGKVAAAYPGTSNHGRGLSLDLGPTAAQAWVRDNGMTYGWSWAEGRSVGEPWHFTYVK